MRLNVRVKGITLPVKGAILAFNSLGDASPGARRLHRPKRVCSIASPQLARDFSLDFWETAAKRLRHRVHALTRGPAKKPVHRLTVGGEAENRSNGATANSIKLNYRRKVTPPTKDGAPLNLGGHRSPQSKSHFGPRANLCGSVATDSRE
jgi:hypothetical protein